jgi:hypothetical protein
MHAVKRKPAASPNEIELSKTRALHSWPDTGRSLMFLAARARHRRIRQLTVRLPPAPSPPFGDGRRRTDCLSVLWARSLPRLLSPPFVDGPGRTDCLSVLWHHRDSRFVTDGAPPLAPIRDGSSCRRPSPAASPAPAIPREHWNKSQLENAMSARQNPRRLRSANEPGLPFRARAQMTVENPPAIAPPDAARGVSQLDDGWPTLLAATNATTTSRSNRPHGRVGQVAGSLRRWPTPGENLPLSCRADIDTPCFHEIMACLIWTVRRLLLLLSSLNLQEEVRPCISLDGYLRLTSRWSNQS